MSDVLVAVKPEQYDYVEMLIQEERFSTPEEVVAAALDDFKRANQERIDKLNLLLDEARAGVSHENFDFDAFRAKMKEKYSS